MQGTLERNCYTIGSITLDSWLVYFGTYYILFRCHVWFTFGALILMLDKFLDNLQAWSITALVYVGMALWCLIFLIIGFSYL